MENSLKTASFETKPDYLKMYEIPGHEKIDQHSFERYLANEKRWGQKIRDVAASKEHILTEIRLAPPHERAELVRQALNNPNVEIRIAAADLIAIIPEPEQIELVYEALNNSNVEIQKIAAKMIAYIPTHEQARLIRKALSNSDIEVQVETMHMFNYEQHINLRPLVTYKVREGLNSLDVKVQKKALEMISYAPDIEKEKLRRLAQEKVLQALRNPDIEIQAIAATMIYALPHSQQLQEILVEKIRNGLDNPDVKVQKVASEMIWYASSHELINKALSNPSVDVQKVAMRLLIKNAPPHERAELVRQALNNPNIGAQKAAVEMIGHVPDSEGLFNLAIQKVPAVLIKPPLYNQGNINKDKFSRKPFKKSGSETTLIGGDLKDEVIIRHIDSTHFLAWKALYEDHNFWKKEGFDYVPIEPIVSFRPDEDGKVAVFSGVLDLSFKEWEDMTKLFVPDLENQKNKIIAVLKKRNFTHGHPHNGNFVLRFKRNKDGNPDMTQTPLIYMIDFDQAVSP